MPAEIVDDRGAVRRRLGMCGERVGLHENGTIDYEYLVQEEGRAPYRCSDPYRFRRVRFTAEDERLFVRGEHLRLFEKLDARPTTRGDAPGVEFAVWAPAAQRVSVVGTFDAWEPSGVLISYL